MATTVENPSPVHPDEGFDPLEFWIRNRSRILLYGALLFAAVLIYAVWEFSKQRTAGAAEMALGKATDAAGYAKVIQDYPEQPAAASARLLLATAQRAEGKYEESNATLRAFIEKYPGHELLPGAYMSQAANLEIMGKLDEALSNYQQILAAWPTSFAAAGAWIGQARVLQQQGKKEEARRAYETVITQFPDSLFLSEAFRESQKLKK